MATKTSSRSKKSGSSNSPKRGGSKRSTGSSNSSSKSKSKKQSGSAAGKSRNPSQENKGQVGDEGHARTRPSETRSVVEREGHQDDDGDAGGPRTDYKDYSVVDPKKIEGGPDVLLAVPVVKVDEIDLEVEDVHAQVAVLAEVRKLVKIGVGVEAHLDKVELKIEGVEAQALLKAKLNNVTAILERVLLSLDRNPALLRSVGRSLEEIGAGTGDLVDESGDAVEDVGRG